MRRSDEALTLLSPRYTVNPDEEDLLLLAAALTMSGRTQTGQVALTAARHAALEVAPSSDPLRSRFTTPRDSALLAVACLRYASSSDKAASKWFFKMVLEDDPRNPFALDGVAHFTDDEAARL